MIPRLLPLLALLPLFLCAFTARQTETVVRVEFYEPVTKANGQPLNDLAFTKIHYEMNGTTVTVATMTATSPSGGGYVVRTVTVPVPMGEERTVRMWATAHDAVQSSTPSATEVFIIDRLAPAPPPVKLLDLFCGAGGAAMGYHRAGFKDITGVDIKPQPRYPFKFVQADAMTYPLEGFSAIHASPPCQAFTAMKTMWNAKKHEDLLTPTRKRLDSTGTRYVIENVEGAPMAGYVIILCGSSFGLGADDARLQRHRLFETNVPMLAPACNHGMADRVIGVYGGHGRDRRRKVNTQDFSTAARRRAMGIDWMTSEELSQAIPPAYTEFIGRHLIKALS